MLNKGPLSCGNVMEPPRGVAPRTYALREPTDASPRVSTCDLPSGPSLRDINADEIVELVAGVPPAQLGGGRLRDALDAVAPRSPVPVSVTFSIDAAGDADTETALFYICSEALANAVKHADANRIDITLRRVNSAIEAVISDDGRGGADPSGRGCRGSPTGWQR